jgi:phosphatidylglycerophosphate synthase
MHRPSPVDFFKRSLKSETYHADEIINIYVLRPIAAIIVWVVYPTNITPNHITATAIAVGLVAAVLYGLNAPFATVLAGLTVTLKDILDDADGQLARAKQMYSRRGRFLDSIGDIIVNIALFSTMTWVVYLSIPSPMTVVLGVLSFFGITLRVSYHVFYQTSFLHLDNRYRLNRITEEITEEDLQGDQIALRLQRIFRVLYGWQDRLMDWIDLWCRDGLQEEEREEWYSDRLGLRLSGLLGFGTEYALLMVCSVADALPLYLLLNVVLMNGVWLAAIAYRRFVLSARIRVR